MLKLEKLKNFLKGPFPIGIPMFNEETDKFDIEMIYDADGIQVFRNLETDHIEIIGLSKDEFKSLEVMMCSSKVSYQEALDKLYEGYENGMAGRHYYDILQELVNKSTPKKPIGKHTDYKCPVCSRRVRSGKGSSSHQRDNVCQRCYQVLDWSDV